MRLGIIAFFLGVLTLHSLTDLPAPVWLWLLPAALLGMIFLPGLWRLPAWGAAGFLWTLCWVAPAQMQLPAQLQGLDLDVEGWIVSLPRSYSRSTQFQLEVSRLQQGDRTIPYAGQIRLNWYNDAPLLQVGDRWRLTVRLQRPRGLANPGGFDYERWLFSAGIHATGYVRTGIEKLAAAERYPVNQFRQTQAARLTQALPDHPFTGILIALAVGEQQGISDDQWEVLRRTGTAHLVAISGLHIALVAGFAFALVRRLWACSARLVWYWPAPKAGAVGALLAALAYALLAGLSVPTQRALVMVAVALLVLIGQRAVAPSRVLALALLVVLLLDPVAPLSGSLWLSFGAVAAILYVVSGRYGGGWLWAWLGIQFAIQLALLPLSLDLFQSFSLIAPLANLVAIPWVSVTTVPLTLLAVLAGLFSEAVQVSLLAAAAQTLVWLWQMLGWLSALPWAQLPLAAPPLWALLLAVPAIALGLAPRGVPGRWLGAVLCLPLLFFPHALPPPGGFWLTVLDVGSGLAVTVRTHNHTLVYDTGPRLGGARDAGGAVLVPFLRWSGVAAVDTVLISHADRQHSGGVRSLLEALPVRQVLTSSVQDVPIEGAQPCRAGQAWEWDGVHFTLLHPTNGFSGDNASCVLHVQGRYGAALLPGDIETSAEAALLRRHGSDLAADVLIAPHQGNRNFSLPAFLAAISPRYVLLSTDYNNRHGYPRPDTLARYAGTGATLLNTAEQGALTLRLDSPAGPVVARQRAQMRRYWHTP